MTPTRTRLSMTRKAFTLIELLTVIAIIGILAGILIPTVGSARTSANKAKTKAQFNQYALALQQYRSEYGYWPEIGGLRSGNTVDLNTDSKDFILALTGRNPTSNNVDREKNRKGIAFISFSENEFFEKDNGERDRTKLADAFNNPYIRIRVDHDNNGEITGLPNVDSIGTTIKATVAIWTRKGGSAENDNDTGEGYQSVYSWN